LDTHGAHVVDSDPLLNCEAGSKAHSSAFPADVLDQPVTHSSGGFKFITPTAASSREGDGLKYLTTKDRNRSRQRLVVMTVLVLPQCSLRETPLSHLAMLVETHTKGPLCVTINNCAG
jgi:hypothetical protein